MVRYLKERKLDAAALVLALLISGLAFAQHYHCWSPADLHRPWFIREDIPLLAGYFQAEAEGDRGPFQVALIHRLNAPFQANWSDFPTTEESLYALGGLLTRLGGFIWAYNVCLLLAHLLATVSFYCSSRWLGARPSWSALGAIAFANSRYLFVRDTVHINLSYCWLLPFYWVAARWLWDGNLTKKRWLGLGLLALGVATLHPYYWYFWLIMLFPAALRQLSQRRPGGFALLALSVLLLTVSHIDSFLSWSRYGKSFVAWERSLDELQLYALRLPEFVLPFQHRWTDLELFAQLHYYKPMYGHGMEMDSSYMGLVALLGALWMLTASVLRIVRGQRLEFEAGYTLWLLLVALGGGGNMLLGSFGLLLFRCSCRFSILIFCGFVLYLATRASRLNAPRGAHWLASLALVPVLLWDQTTESLPAAHLKATEAYVETEKAMVGYLESNLPPNSMVFQWPLTGYPETPPLRKLAHYEELTAWMFSRNLRFSYGDCRGRPSSQWQWRMQGENPAAVMATAERYGFSALALYRKGLSPQEAARWPDTAAYKTPDGSRWVYRLHPPANPEVPQAYPVVFYDHSFYGQEKEENHTWRWTSASGTMALLLPDPCPFTLHFGLTAYGEEREVEISVDGRKLWTVKASTGDESVTPVEIDLSHLRGGNHTVHLEIGGNHTLAEDKRLLLLQVRDVHFEKRGEVSEGE